jgi:hypothetical protein
VIHFTGIKIAAIKKGCFMNKVSTIVAITILTITFSFFSVYSSAAASNEYDVYFKVESFTWKEFAESGEQRLKESGPIYGIGASAKSSIAGSLTLKGKAELFGGSVDFDGQTLTGTSVETDTDYAGVKIEVDGGWKIMVKEVYFLEPFAGFGGMGWKRNIASTGNTDEFEETWKSFYSRLGIRGNRFYPNHVRVFAEAGVRIPLHNETKIEGPGFDATVEPGNRASAFVEIGLKWKKFKITVTYEGLRFAKSDTKTVNNIPVSQPKSEANIFGVNIGAEF